MALIRGPAASTCAEGVRRASIPGRYRFAGSRPVGADAGDKAFKIADAEDA